MRSGLAIDMDLTVNRKSNRYRIRGKDDTIAIFAGPVAMSALRREWILGAGPFGLFQGLGFAAAGGLPATVQRRFGPFCLRPLGPKGPTWFSRITGLT